MKRDAPKSQQKKDMAPKTTRQISIVLGSRRTSRTSAKRRKNSSEVNLVGLNVAVVELIGKVLNVASVELISEFVVLDAQASKAA